MELNIEEFVRRYLAVWNEPDPAVRRRNIAELWTEDAVQHLESTEYRGHQELEPRVAEAYQTFVAAGGFVFVSAGAPVAHHDTAVLRINMIPAGAGGGVAWSGTSFLELAADGRIRREYQYALPAEESRTVVDEFLARLAAGDPEQIAELFAEPVDWWLDWPAEGHPGVPWIRPRSSRADVADHFRALAEFHEPARPAEGAPMTVLVDGADAVLLGEIRQTVRATGLGYTAGCALRLTVEDGLITRYHVYEDSLSVARAFEADTPAAAARG